MVKIYFFLSGPKKTFMKKISYYLATEFGSMYICMSSVLSLRKKLPLYIE